MEERIISMDEALELYSNSEEFRDWYDKYSKKHEIEHFEVAKSEMTRLVGQYYKDKESK